MAITRSEFLNGASAVLMTSGCLIPAQRWWIVEAEGRPDSIEPALACLKLLKTWNA